MCGRFTQRMTWRELHERLGLIGPAQNVRPRYNVAPAQSIAAVRAGAAGRTLSMLRWGLIPAWALCGIPHNAHDGNVLVMLSIIKIIQYFKKLMLNHIT